jgi:hypothetical protein
MRTPRTFKEWYSTEGIRSYPSPGEHHHEYYTRIAFEAGKVAGTLECYENAGSLLKYFKMIDQRLNDVAKLNASESLHYHNINQ